MANKSAKIFLIIISFIIFVMGITLVGISYLPFELVKTKIDVFTVNITADFFSAEILLKLRFIGIAVILIGFMYSAVIEEIQQPFDRLFISLSSFFREIFSKFLKVIRKEDKIHIYSFIILIIIAIIVRLFYLFKPIHYEEAFTFLNYAQKPLFMSLSDYSYSSNHLFSTLLVHISYRLFGNNLWAIRLPALIFGILIIPMAYTVVRIFYNKNAAILSAGIIAASPILIGYSTNATGYIMICFFFMVLLALGKYILYKDNLFPWLLLAVLSAIGFYTIPTMSYPFGIFIVWLLLSIISKDTKFSYIYLFKRFFLFLIITIILTFILYVPILIRSDLISIINNKFADPLSWWHAFSILPSSVNSIWNQWNQNIPIAISIFFAMGFIASLFLHKKIASHKVPIISAVFIYCIPLFLMQRNIPSEAAWLFLLPIYIILSSAGIIFLLRLILSKIKNYKSIIISILSVILSIGLSLVVFYSQSAYYSNEVGTLKDAEEITIMLKDRLETGDMVLSKSPSDAILIYYSKKHNIPVDYFELSSDLYSNKRAFIVVNKTNGQTLDEIFNSYGSSVLVYSSPKLLKEYKSAYIYETHNLKFESKLIFDYNSYSNIEFQNSKLSEDNKEIIIEEGEGKLKLCKIPIIIESNKNYIISFEIRKVKNLDNIIYFDFSGDNYDKREQEFILEPNSISEDYTRVSQILNSGRVPNNTNVNFRVFTYSSGEIIIRNLEIYQIE